MFLLFNHRLTPAQESDAYASLGVECIVNLPADLKALWSNIPAELKEIYDYLEPLRKWLSSQARPGDYALIQGDFGACYLMVSHAFDLGLIPVYSTTCREVTERLLPDGKAELTHLFSHRIYRRYGV
jgi:hypothetical protein